MFQNGMTASSVTFFFGILLCECGYMLGVLTPDSNVRVSLDGLVLVVLLLVVDNMGVALFPLSMNADHLRDVIEWFDTLPAADRTYAETSLRSLVRHLGRQAVATVAMLVTWSLILLLHQRLLCSNAADWRRKMLRSYLLVTELRSIASLFGELVGRSGQSGESDVARRIIDAARRGKPEDEEEE